MKTAFINSSGVLMAWGFTSTNADGQIAIAVDDDFAMPPGSTQYLNGEWQAYTAPVSTQAAATAAIAGALTIASTSAPALNGAYAIDQLSQMDIIAIETSLNAGKGFPGGATLFSYADMSGAMHSFTQANFTDFAAAVRDYVYALKSVIAGASTTLPPSTATIA